MKPLLPATTVFLALCIAPAASADLIYETEPNNSIATANGTVGNNNDLRIYGQVSTGGDLDFFSFRVISAGQISLTSVNVTDADETVNLAIYDSNGTVVLLSMADRVPAEGGSYSVGKSLAVGTYYAEIWAPTTVTVSETYQLDIGPGSIGTRGIVAGTVPAPSSLLLLGPGLASAAIVAWRRKAA